MVVTTLCYGVFFKKGKLVRADEKIMGNFYNFLFFIISTSSMLGSTANLVCLD